MIVKKSRSTVYYKNGKKFSLEPVQSPGIGSLKVETSNPLKTANLELSWPSVLIAIPVKNSAKYLLSCLNALASMDYPQSKIRFVFVYGKSKDKTLKIIEDFFRGKTFEYEVYDDPVYDNPTGNSLYIADSMNVLSSHIRNEEFVLFVDSDIISIPSNTLRELIKAGKDIVAPIPKYNRSSRLLLYDFYGFRLDGKTTEHLVRDSNNEFFHYKTPTRMDSIGTFALVRKDVVKDVVWQNPFPWIRYCQNARRMGYKIWTAPYLTVIHANLDNNFHKPLEYYVKKGIVPKTELDKIHDTFKEPKITVGIIALNEEEYIEYSLKNIYDTADEIIIVEGSTKLWREANPDTVKSDGSSIDKTAEIIKNFPDPENKITLIQGKWEDKLEMRNQYMQKAKGDYIWLVDADEFYKKEDQKKLRKFLIENPDVEEVRWPFRNFWHGFNIICKGSLAATAQRLWKNLNCKLSRHDTVVKLNNVPLKVVHNNDICCYHYGYVKSKQNMRAKTNFYKLRYQTTKGLYSKEYEDVLEFLESWFNWNSEHKLPYKLPGNMQLIDYNISDHPEIIKSHPYYKQQIQHNSILKLKTNLRVGMLFCATDPNGVSGGQYAAWRCLEALKLNNVDTTYIGDDEPSYSNNLNIPIIQIDLKKNLMNSNNYSEYVFDEMKRKVSNKFDVIIGIPSFFSMPATLYAEHYNIPIVNFVYESPYSLLKYAGNAYKDFAQSLHLTICKNAIIKSNLILAVSDSSMMWAKKWFIDFPNLNIDVLYPPINDIVACKIRAKNLPKKNQLITVGYFAGKKETAKWLAEVVKRTKRKLDCIIMSQRPDKPEYDKPILDINPSTIITHNITEEEKFTLLAQSQLCINFLFTGGGDAQMKEAFCVGTLGVSFNAPCMIECNGGFSEIIPEGITQEYPRVGKVEPELDEILINKTVEKVDWLLDNPEYMKMRTEYGRKYIEENHTTKVVGERFKKLLMGILYKKI